MKKITEEMCDNLLIDIENKYQMMQKRKADIERLKRQINNDKYEEETPVIESLDLDEVEDDEEINEDPMSFYVLSYRNLSDEFRLDDIISILPNRSHYDYENIIKRLIAESYKEIKEINELLLSDSSICIEELEEYKGLIGKEQLKIKYLNEALNPTIEIEEKKNNIFLVPTIGGNIRVIDEIEDMAIDYYPGFLELINSIINGTFKDVKTFNSNGNLMGLSEVRGSQIRLVFARLNKNTYAIITAFIKKCDTGSLYKDTLNRKAIHYKQNEALFKEKIKDKEFMEANDRAVCDLLSLLNYKENNKEYKKVD